MQVHCRCGQSFTLPEVRLPHPVSCHVCGAKFIVLENGTTEAITTDSVSATCRCGKVYTVRFGPFPRDLHCLDCNRNFSVLSTGETICLHDEPVGRAATPAKVLFSAASSTAIQVAAEPVPDAFADETTLELLAAAAGLPNLEMLEQELSVIDLEWEAEQYQACVVRVFGHMVMSSAAMLLAIESAGAILVVGSLFLAGVFFLNPFSALLFWGLGILALICIGFYGAIKRRGLERLKIAEEEWRRKRREALRKYRALMG